MENIFVNESAGLLDTIPRASAANRYIGNVFSAKDEIKFTVTNGFPPEFADNRYHSADGTITEVLLDDYDKKDVYAMYLDESNRPIDAVHFEEGARVFSAAGLTIDLTDIGPAY